MNNEIEVIKEQSGQMTPMQRMAELKERKLIIGSVMKEVMKENEHFGKIPGTNKQTLLKSGAECLTSVFGLAPRFTVKQDDFGNGHREYVITCELYAANGNFLGSGVGSCSTMEKKYRYRSIREYISELPKDFKDRKAYYYSLGQVGWKDENNVWGLYKQVQGENPDIADQYNTVLKIAKKRALVDATLTVTGASDIFTQDVEDFVEHPEQPAKWEMNWTIFFTEKWNSFPADSKASEKMESIIRSYGSLPEWNDISKVLETIWTNLIKGKELDEKSKKASDAMIDAIKAGKLQ